MSDLPQIAIDCKRDAVTDDVTVHWTIDEYKSAVTNVPIDLTGSQTDLDVRLRFTDASAAVPARAFICLCNQNKWVSATFRLQDEYKSLATKAAHGWPPIIKVTTTAGPPRPGHYPIPTEMVVASLIKAIDPSYNRTEWSGLIVVAAGTNTSKSTLVKTLAVELVRRQGTNRHHLVTHEDPIEDGYRLKVGCDFQTHRLTDDTLTARKHGFCFTPRENRVDTLGLADTLRGALRQTPGCVLVGETRIPGDWAEVLHFAGTGHLEAVSELDRLTKVVICPPARCARRWTHGRTCLG